MSAKIFYSWQSELPNNTNRGLIGQALESATKAIREDSSVEVSPRVDKDTEGVPGAPDIGAAIFAKIDAATVFVCDVSLLNRGPEARPTPNPNVLVELGYALARVGWNRIIMVVNDAYGPVSDLPFDLNKKRALVYRSTADETERAPARKALAGALERALREILEHHEEQLPFVMPPELQRTVALLRSIPLNAHVTVFITGGFLEGRLVGVFEKENAVEFVYTGGRSSRVALDQVERVWRSERGWCVSTTK